MLTYSCPTVEPVSWKWVHVVVKANGVGVFQLEGYDDLLQRVSP